MAFLSAPLLPPQSIPGMLLPDVVGPALPASHYLSVLHRYGVLPGVLYPFNPADGIQIPWLALAPEGIILPPGRMALAYRQHYGSGEHAVQPTEMTTCHLLCGLVNRIVVLRDVGMGVKLSMTLKYLAMSGVCRKVRGAASAENHHIDIILHEGASSMDKTFAPLSGWSGCADPFL